MTNSQQDGCAVSVLIVSYRTRDLTRRCLASVFSELRAVNGEVVVLDNGSDDGSPGMVEEAFPEARLFALPTNVGFARGVNLAARAARGEFLLLVNPDAVVLPDAIAEILRFAHDHPQHGIYGGQLRRPDGSVDPQSCSARPSLWSLACFGLGLSALFPRSRLFDPESLGRWPRDSVREVGYVTGCFLLVRRLLWEVLGGFDPRFFMYSEDVDLAVRAAALGYSSVIDPGARANHDSGASSTAAGSGILMLTGRATFLRKHWSGPAARFGLAMLWLGTAVRTGLGAVPGRREGRGDAWPDIWRARRTWLKGYPDEASEVRPDTSEPGPVVPLTH